MSPRISIIVPVYNVESILKYCVDSILRQTFTNFEVLLIDDGSKDNSGKICDELAKTDKRISVFHKKNGGLSDARNYGIEHANGDNYLFIDSDDVLHKDFCKVLLDLQEKYNAEITSTDLIEFYDVSEIENLDNKSYEPNTFIYKKSEILKEYYKPADKQKIYHGLCMKLYKKELFVNGLRFKNGRLHEDLFITYQLLDRCNTFVFVDLPYYYYYQKNTNSITKNYKEKNLIDEYDALQLMIEYFKNKEEIKNEFSHFIFYHYLYLYNRTYVLPKTQVVFNKRIEIKKILLIYNKILDDSSKINNLKRILQIRYHYLSKLLLSIKKVFINV